MSAQRSGAEPLRFRGTPGSLSAAVSDADDVPRKLPVRLALASTAERATRGAAAPLVARASRIEGDLVLRLALPPRTPPGRYEGTVEVGGVERAVVIDVEPEIELQASPDQLSLRGAPGEQVPADISLANAGNVPFEIRGAYAFGIFALGGLERALHRAYTDKRPEGERRVDYLGDRLAEEHGGIVRIAVKEGEGMLEPGEARNVKLVFHVPSSLYAGRTYTGTLELGDLVYFIRLIVTESKTPPDPALR
jgi:hypothetical protein